MYCCDISEQQCIVTSDDYTCHNIIIIMHYLYVWHVVKT